MRYFSIPSISKSLLAFNSLQKLLDIGNSLPACQWSIRPYKFTDSDWSIITPILDQIPLKPHSIALLVTTKFSKSSIHCDHIPNPPSYNGLAQSTGRITAINIDLQDDSDGCFEYIGDNNQILDKLQFSHAKCLRVDLPHRSNNSLSSKNRIILSFSYLDSIDRLHDEFQNFNIVTKV